MHRRPDVGERCDLWNLGGHVPPGAGPHGHLIVDEDEALFTSAKLGDSQNCAQVESLMEGAAHEQQRT